MIIRDVTSTQPLLAKITPIGRVQMGKKSQVGLSAVHMLGLLVGAGVLYLLLFATRDDGTSGWGQITGVNRPPVSVPVAPTSRSEIESVQAKELAATMLNLNKLLCATVVEIRPLAVNPDVHEVTCIEYRGGSATKTYHLDSKTGKAWPV